MTGRPAPTSSNAARERLRRATEDGERLYRKRMHGEPTIADDNRIDGILTLDLPDALAALDRVLAELAVAVRERDQARHALREIRDLPSQHDLLFNAEAKALHYIAARALAEGGEPA